MRAMKVKALRKAIYGDMSHRTREYAKHHAPTLWEMGIGLNGPIVLRKNPTCICVGLRRAYQIAKKIGYPPINPISLA